MQTVFCKTQEETQRLGESLGACLREGDAVLLRGEMGAGKSVLTRAAAKAMGVEGPVPSPTFTILNIHDGRKMKLYHFDLYRLSDVDELYGMGLDEMIPPADGACMIEWPEQAEEAMPEDALTIHAEYAEDSMARLFTLTPGGAFDQARIDEIMQYMEEHHEHSDD